MKSLLSKLVHTFTNFRSTAYHHYGDSYSSLFKMAYNSLFRLNEFILFERVLDDSVRPPTLNPDYVVTKPNSEELGEIRRNKELPREFFYDQFHGVRRCYVVLHNGQPAYIHWVYVKGEPNRFLKLEEGVGELNYNTTLPEYRGQKLMGKMMVYIMNDLKESGFSKAVGVVSATNPAALKSMAAAGFRQVRKFRTIGYFNRKYRVAKS